MADETRAQILKQHPEYGTVIESDLEMILAHGEGEIGRVLISGLGTIPGSKIQERLAWFNGAGDSLRRLLVSEPRGFAQMSTNIILPADNEQADAAFVILQADKAHAMSGSNTLCITTALLESGQLPFQGNETSLHFETAAGLVPVTAYSDDGKHCHSVRIENAGGYAETLDATLEVAGLGKITVDIAWGGVFFALVEAEALGVVLEPSAARTITDKALCVLRAAQEAFQPVHQASGTEGIAYAMVLGKAANGDLRGANVMPPGRIDRSPCGTGTTARLACLAARGGLSAGETYTARSLIDSQIKVECLDIATAANGAPSPKLAITGRGRVYGRTTLLAEPWGDPFAEGFVLADTWGADLSLIRR